MLVSGYDGISSGVYDISSGITAVVRARVLDPGYEGISIGYEDIN